MLTAASGLNTTLIEESADAATVQFKRRASSMPPGYTLASSNSRTRIAVQTSSAEQSRNSGSSPSFAVIQSLVALLTQPVMTSLHKSSSFAENMKRECTAEASVIASERFS